MDSSLVLDREAIAAVCRAHGVQRLRLFGSAASARFDPSRSDVDVLVEFTSGVSDPFDAYFGLKEDLERLLGREVDLVMASAVRNPHFAASAVAESEELYAA
jgi:predicted nucleotidyltransferase